MRKIVSIITALTFIFSMCTVSFADSVQTNQDVLDYFASGRTFTYGDSSITVYSPDLNGADPSAPAEMTIEDYNSIFSTYAKDVHLSKQNDEIISEKIENDESKGFFGFMSALATPEDTVISKNVGKEYYRLKKNGSHSVEYILDLKSTLSILKSPFGEYKEILSADRTSIELEAAAPFVSIKKIKDIDEDINSSGSAIYIWVDYVVTKGVNEFPIQFYVDFDDSVGFSYSL